MNSRGTQIYLYMYPLSPNPHTSKLALNIEQSFVCYIIAPLSPTPGKSRHPLGVNPSPLAHDLVPGELDRRAWKPGSQHAGEKRGVAGLLLGRTERAARAAELQLCAQAR